MENPASDQTTIYYSRRKTVRWMRVFAIFFVLGLLLPIIFSAQLWAWFFGVLIIIAATIKGIIVYMYYRNTQPQIIISERGIQTASAPFYAWKDIKNENALEINESKSKTAYLVYETPQGNKRHDLMYLDTNEEQLRSLLKTYRDKSAGIGHSHCTKNTEF